MYGLHNVSILNHSVVKEHEKGFRKKLMKLMRKLWGNRIKTHDDNAKKSNKIGTYILYAFSKQIPLFFAVDFSLPEPKVHGRAYSIAIRPSSICRRPSLSNIVRPSKFSNSISSEAMKPIFNIFHI